MNKRLAIGLTALAAYVACIGADSADGTLIRQLTAMLDQAPQLEFVP